MLIEKCERRSAKTFAELSDGCCFEDDGFIFMKVKPLFVSNQNAVCFNTNALGLFDQDAIVYPVNARLVVSYE